jgi:hypothetical protein
MSKFWLVVLTGGLRLVINALTDREAREHAERLEGKEALTIDECDVKGKVFPKPEEPKSSEKKEDKKEDKV